MSMSLEQVLEHGGYQVTLNKDDALWLLSKRNEFDELIEQAEELLEEE